ncbi:MAG: hypothetical protein COA42_08840 [Alteromonadaceae bacterium]|nr:MAG: hypothetical protein COA42_08840 [Alteromonadaceae bacterium]
MAETSSQQATQCKQHQSRQEPQFTKVELRRNPDSGDLEANLSPSSVEQKIDTGTLNALLRESEFCDATIDQAKLATLVTQIASNQRGNFVIGKAQPYLHVEFQYDPDSRLLTAEIEQCDRSTFIIQPELSFSSLQKRIADEGYSNFEIKTKVLGDIIRLVKDGQTDSLILGSKPEYTRIRLHFDQESNTLTAELIASEDNPELNAESLEDLIKTHKFDSFYFEPYALDKILACANKNERGIYPIGQRKDATVTIEYENEAMQAFISVTPPYGGRALDNALLKVYLDNEGVDQRSCDQAVLKNVLTGKSDERILFATGAEPTDGCDAKFEALIEEVIYKQPKESKTGKIDTREILDFTQIEAGVKLMRRSAATPGTNGYNVKGLVIPAVDGEDIPFDENLIGAVVSAEDPNVLISETKGHPVILPHAVKVDNTVSVNNVDMNTGHITYDGSVLVKGEVMPGMKIKVTGDIIVQGVVTKAYLYAKNNITIKCGVIGSDPTKDGADSPEAILKAGGDIFAQYVNQTKLHAGRDIVIKEYISHCECEAKQHVIAGEGGGKGRIFGGDCLAQEGIRANSLGIDGGIKTNITVGAPKAQHTQFQQLIEMHDNRQTQWKKLNGILKKYLVAVKQNPGDIEKINKAKAVKKVLTDIAGEIQKMEDSIEKIKKHFKKTKDAEICVRKTTFPNVFMSINGAEFQLRQEGKGGTFVKSGDDVRWNN